MYSSPPRLLARRVCRVRIHAHRDKRSPRVLPVKACSMASSTPQRGAARAPPPPDQLASFYKLGDKKAIAGLMGRHARNAELSAEAAVQAEALFGDDSLVVARLRFSESVALAVLSSAASGAEREALTNRALAAQVSLITLLLRRLKADTLLPGTIRDEELDYEAHTQAAGRKATNNPVPSPAVLRTWASTMGYNTLIDAMFKSLNFFIAPHWTAAQRRLVESFVLQGLDVIPRAAGIPANLVTGEDSVVMAIEKFMSPRNYDLSFCAAVLRKWRSDAVSGVLRARGILQTGVAKHEQTQAEFHARQRDDIAKHGLRDCALPSCSKKEKTAKEYVLCTGCRPVVYCCLEHQALDWDAHRQACADIVEHGLRDCALFSCSKSEKTVKEFAGCSGCRSVVYCCLEHQALDWRAHKKACREMEAARLAEEEAEQVSEEDAGGGAGAA